MRKHWIDNLRWVTILLVLLYHVIWFFNNKGVFGGVGGFGECPQYQDAILYLLYPWFMPLLFILAGISASFALSERSASGWFGARTRKLLVPSTIGLFLLHWITGWVNTHLAGTDVLAAVPQPAKYFSWVLSGVGPLWFIQVLWLCSLILLPVRALDRRGGFRSACGRMGIVPLILLGVLFWAGERSLIQEPRMMSLDGMYNLYKPFFYLIPFLLGFFVFSHEEVQRRLAQVWIPLMAVALISGGILTFTGFGQDFTSPQFQGSPLNNLYGWLMCLAMMGLFAARFDRTGAFAGYMTRSSFGIYIVHYLLVAGAGYLLKYHTQLPAIVIYLLLFAAVFGLSPVLYECLHRIPVIRWCIFGEKGESKRKES